MPGAAYLQGKGLFIRLENPLQIKRPGRIKREKTDKADSLGIAWHACRHQDRARICQLPGKAVTASQNLPASRERLVKNKTSLQASAKEMRRVCQKDSTARFIHEQSMRDIGRLEKETGTVEKRMPEVIGKSGEMADNCHLAVSIKGTGRVNAVAILVHTRNSTTFESSRQFSCFCGMAPFDDSPGTARKRGKHTRRTGSNREIKALPTQAAKAAAVYDSELRAYYQRKLAEGKPMRVVINNVKNKLLHHIFAVVRKKQAFQDNFNNPLKVLQTS